VPQIKGEEKRTGEPLIRSEGDRKDERPRRGVMALIIISGEGEDRVEFDYGLDKINLTEVNGGNQQILGIKKTHRGERRKGMPLHP